MGEGEKLTLGMIETKQVIDFTIALGKAIESSLANDGKFTISDLPNFMPAFIKLMPAIENIQNVTLELTAATKEEVDELKQYIADSLELENVNVEKYIERSVGIALDIYTLLRDFFNIEEDDKPIDKPIDEIKVKADIEPGIKMADANEGSTEEIQSEDKIID